jgi:hypothetical protein
MTVRQLLDSMDSAELSEWLAFDRAYTLPDDYFLAGVLGPAVTAPYAKGEPPGPGDFVPFFRPPSREQSWEDQRAIVHARMAAAGQKPGEL